MRELELLSLQKQLEESEQPYALATVVSVTGSASAKAGSKCLISHDGKNLWGWVGGGCAESFTIGNALEALKEGVPRVITADLDDEVFGLGMPCGGKMEIYVEPRLPREKVPLPFREGAALRALAEHYGFAPEFTGTAPAPAEPREIVATLAGAIARARGLEKKSLSLGPVPHLHLNEEPSEFLLLGHSRITQELAKLGALLGWNTRAYGIGLEKNLYPSSVRALEAQPDYAGLDVKHGGFVVVASHHKGDHHYIHAALEANAPYVGLVASAKRAGLVFDHLKAIGLPAVKLGEVSAPAGLLLHCRNPGEIALSIVAEIIDRGSARP